MPGSILKEMYEENLKKINKMYLDVSNKNGEVLALRQKIEMQTLFCSDGELESHWRMYESMRNNEKSLELLCKPYLKIKEKQTKKLEEWYEQEKAKIIKEFNIEEFKLEEEQWD